MGRGTWTLVAVAVAACSLTHDLDETLGSAGDAGGVLGGDAAGDVGAAGWLAGGSGAGASGGAHDGSAASGGSGGTAPGSGGGGGTAPSGGSGGGCSSNQKLCGGACVTKGPANGCDATSCSPCSLAHAQATCAAGQCAVGSCSAGYGDCDKTAANGCETALGTSANCKACGDVCSAPIGTTACVNGACKVTACPSNRGDCDGIAANGCEADLTTTATCASCGQQCAPGFACAQTPSGSYVCACNSDANCLNGTCVTMFGVCSCGGNACQLNQRCTLIGTCF